ncbi:5507_t:CDS:2 [Cetraspora pellucida]|uniref:5507_t:CDS:1 n=1 Tax=Cetraspora pellucida TaxID=1433469 RepID=A0A9N9C9R6_9GLOM|nr:5507_t:CDS:2 [Cetraspora pellucida]
MSNLLKHIQEKNVRKLAKKATQVPSDKLPPVLQNRKTATLVLKALKKDQYMPALVFEWNEAGFNDVLTASGFRNGIASQNKAMIITNLTTNGATSYNDVGIASTRLPDVCTSVIRINRITERDTGTPSTVFDLEDYTIVFVILNN